MTLNREMSCAAVSVPATLSPALTGYRWSRDLVGQSGGVVYRLHGRSGADDLFLKHGQGSVAEDIIDEMVRLRWMAERVPVPAVRQFVGAPGEAWLLMSAVAGETAYEALQADPEAQFAITDALAQFLRRLHAIPPQDCPFGSDHLFRLARARERIDAGLVDEDDFDDERQGWTAEQVWEALHNLLPLASDRVVTHGDFSLDNILMREVEVVGCIDVGRVGIADRYQDLAILWNSLSEFGPSVQARLLSQYGVTEIDHRKLEFHLLLDELF